METWYVLEGGGVADPRDVAPDSKGVLRAKGGTAVAMRGEVPSTRGVDPEAERAKGKPKDKSDEPKAAAKDMKPEQPKRGYSTRESKAD